MYTSSLMIVKGKGYYYVETFFFGEFYMKPCMWMLNIETFMWILWMFQPESRVRPGNE